MNIGILLIGFILLIKGADFFVDGSSSVAKRLLVPPLIIGLTIVALGTSLPELSVSVISSLNGGNELAVSNVIGSNLFNLIVVLGASALFLPLRVDDTVLKRDYPLSIAGTILLLVVCAIGMELGRLDGVLFCVLFVLFIGYTLHNARKARYDNQTMRQDEAEESASDYRILPMWKSILYIIGGAAAVKFGGDFVVDAAVFIAQKAGLSQTLIGLTIVSCGTSLPELVTSIQATRKGELDLAIGNVVGSNIFNILLILGVAGALSPIQILPANLIDMGVLLVSNFVVWYFCWSRKRIDRNEGICMLIIYALYLTYIILRK